MLGPELLKEMEQIVKQVQDNLKVAQDRQKSQADSKRTPKEFQVGENVFIKVEPEGEVLVEPDCILGRREITLRNRTIGQLKVQWKHLSLEEATWELESKMQEAYPNLF